MQVEWKPFEAKLRANGVPCVCGVDEAGRGPLAGPVYAAAVMDARCQQVYTALFRLHDGRAERLTDDEALMLSDLQQRLSGLEGPVYLVGDGAQISWNYLSGKVGQLRMAPAALRFQRASSVAVCAAERMAAGEAVSGDELVPSYLRLPQAERELKKSR